jgi:hypothetical protein
MLQIIFSTYSKTYSTNFWHIKNYKCHRLTTLLTGLPKENMQHITKKILASYYTLHLSKTIVRKTNNGSASNSNKLLGNLEQG